MSQTPGFQLPPEDKARVASLTQEIFVPHLRQAVQEAQAKAPFTEILSAAASAYAHMLDTTVGREAAITLLKSLVTHLESLPLQPATSKMDS